MINCPSPSRTLHPQEEKAKGGQPQGQGGGRGVGVGRGRGLRVILEHGQGSAQGGGGARSAAWEKGTGSGGGGKPKLECTFCNAIGHSIDTCWSKNPTLIPEHIKRQREERRRNKQMQSGVGRGGGFRTPNYPPDEEGPDQYFSQGFPQQYMLTRGGESPEEKEHTVENYEKGKFWRFLASLMTWQPMMTWQR